MKEDINGFTLLEVMISIVIFGMISTLIFSILDRSFVFTEKGEAKILKIEQQNGFIDLVRRQVQGAWVDPRRRTTHINSENEQQFSIVTTSSIMFAGSPLVVAFYEFEPSTNTVYYTERKDFYNPDYVEQFPNQEEMIPLLNVDDSFSLQTDENSDFVILFLNNKEYIFHPFCTKQPEDFDLEQ